MNIKGGFISTLRRLVETLKLNGYEENYVNTIIFHLNFTFLFSL